MDKKYTNRAKPGLVSTRRASLGDDVVWLYHHIFLPPKLPQESEGPGTTVHASSELSLAQLTHDALASWQIQGGSHARLIAQAQLMLGNVIAIHSMPGDGIHEHSLRQALDRICDGQALALHIKAQNAAIMITAANDHLIFEAFELSARNEDVMSSSNRLSRVFPGGSVQIARSLLDQSDFADTLVNSLATMCNQVVPDMQPESKKAGASFKEIRDTTSPAIVSELLFGWLRSLGNAFSLPRIQKQTRDQVNWESTLSPWRRSPMWLMIRVSLQLLVQRSEGGSRHLFKRIMVWVMCEALQSGLDANLASDILFTMSAKITRRLTKLQKSDEGLSEDDPITDSVYEVMSHVDHHISKQWREIQDGDARHLNLNALRTSDFAGDCAIHLPLLDKYIVEVNNRRAGSTVPVPFPRSKLLIFYPNQLPSLQEPELNDAEYAVANLQAFEDWVTSHLEAWAACNSILTVCQAMYGLIPAYHRLARHRYSQNPEANSVMILTIFEMWITCDRAAVSEIDLLRNYDPEVCTNVLQNMLFPFTDQMRRLTRLEKYLDDRKAQGRLPAQQIFSTDSSNGFPYIFCSNSSTHLALLGKIQDAATKDRYAKKAELALVKNQYIELNQRYVFELHYTELVTRYNRRRPDSIVEQCRSDCPKCAYQRRRDALKISVFEEPLPESLIVARSVVFELEVPPTFAYWRDARLYLLQDVLGGELVGARSDLKHRLSHSDPHLTSKYYKQSGPQSRRVDLNSDAKSSHISHYSSQQILSATEYTVCVQNGFRYRYFDTTACRALGTHIFGNTIALQCTYQNLKPWLKEYVVRLSDQPDGKAPNKVIAGQHACPSEMTLEHFKALTTVPLGHRIQWINIMRELAMPAVDFRTADTAVFLLQCIYQTGPSGNSISRSAHAIVTEDEIFAKSVLRHLNTALDRISENWGLTHALSAFVAVAARVLSLNEATKGAALAFLAKARNFAVQWTRLLREKAHEATSNEDRKRFVRCSVEAALVALATFNVDRRYLHELLCSSINQSFVIELSIIVQEGSMTVDQDDTFVKVLLWRHKRMLHHCHWGMFVNHDGISAGITRMWNGFPANGNRWTGKDFFFKEWIMPGDAVNGLAIHYNLLTGELLVNGEPLNEPRKEFRETFLYKTLFQDHQVEVMPSVTPGFKYSTKRKFANYEVLLGMNADGELQARASSDGMDWEVIPSRLLYEHYPLHYSRDYIHWYNTALDEVILQPIDQPWPKNVDTRWKLSRTSTHWKMQKGYSQLVGTKTPTIQILLEILQPLAERRLIHASLNTISENLEIDLPVAKLRFICRPGSAEALCVDYPGMLIAEDQSLGSLVGLKNKLVLHSSTGDKLVLVPESSVSFYRSEPHVRVVINTEAISKVHDLKVDDSLGRLVSKNELGCKLFIAYLHALTSFCVPDPLIGVTGTEQALAILRSKSLLSFTEISQEHLYQIEMIGRLSPGRAYYPPHLSLMQTTSWNDQLSFLSQDDNFITVSEGIIRHYERQIAVSGTTQDIKFPRFNEHSNPCLRQRARILSSMVRVYGSGAEDDAASDSHRYNQRDDKWSNEANTAFNIASMVVDNLKERHYETSVDYLWQTLRGAGSVHAVNKPFTKSSIRYDALCLDRENFHSILQNFLSLLAWLTSLDNTAKHKYGISIWLASLAFAKNSDPIILQYLATVAKHPQVFAQLLLALPWTTTFSISDGRNFQLHRLNSHMQSKQRTCDVCPEWKQPQRQGESHEEHRSRREREWKDNSSCCSQRLLIHFQSQWPCKIPKLPDVDHMHTYFDCSALCSVIKEQFTKWFHNEQLSVFLNAVQVEAAKFPSSRVPKPTFSLGNVLAQSSFAGYLTHEDLFSVAPPLVPDSSSRMNPLQDRVYRLGSVISALHTSEAKSRFEKAWVNDLQDSLNALKQTTRNIVGADIPPRDAVDDHVSRCRERVAILRKGVSESLRAARTPKFPQSSHHQVRITPNFLLQQLSRHCWPTHTHKWRQVLVAFALALTEWQQAQRLASCWDDKDQFRAELRNPGHRDWSPIDHPEWLILEAENGLVIRSVQCQIASEMISPVLGQNTVMQLNMGEGKSTVIVPLIAVTTADGRKLARVIVNRPQSKQMLQMLTSKLCGIINRQIYHLPFARSPRLDDRSAQLVLEIMDECMRSGGVLLAQPEHILSLKHMAPEHFIANKCDSGQRLLEIHDFLDKNSRDIIDESDENFSVRLELVYTMGTQQIIEAGPDRWTLIQQVFELVRRIASDVAVEYGPQVELVQGAKGQFSRLRILKEEAGKALIEQLAELISTEGLPGLPASRQPPLIRQALKRYILDKHIDKDDAELFERSGFWTSKTQPLILLLRGLLAGSILEFILSQKRWRVNYGLAVRDPPTKVAVPYRAKDIPAARSEFSHPDVVIALTCLSYYYGGLCDEDLFTAFSHLMDSDHAIVEYQAWVKDADRLPKAFLQLQGVNLQDSPQCKTDLFPSLKFAKSTIDYFLAQIVFPREMKEFPEKLSASGWDLGKRKTHITTGFSGTKDSRPTLPLSVVFSDLPEQKHTDALVLEHLLRDENSVTIMPDAQPGSSDADRALELIFNLQRPVQVILDVGAQVLELDNLGMAKRWLQRHDESKNAVVFVDDADNVSVVDREGRVELLHASSFANSLATCLVFLDQSHTRGIDLKLPKDYRAAVMLGPRLTKDSLVQACMRMRKLGNGQSLEFCVPRDVHTRILEQQNSTSAAIGVAEVVQWSIAETFAETKRILPLWAIQGQRFVKQQSTWKEGLSIKNASRLLEQEKQTIEERYRPLFSRVQPSNEIADDSELKEIQERCGMFDEIEMSTAPLQEEQERELAPEREQQQQTQRAPPLEAAVHRAHEDVAAFAKSGILKHGSTGYLRAFESLAGTAAISGFPVDLLRARSRLWVTQDFATTVRPDKSGAGVSDIFLRPVQWILTNTNEDHNVDVVMIISPFEANWVLPKMIGAATTLHCYTPRVNKAFAPSDALDFYNHPPGRAAVKLDLGLAAELHAFSGQLYFSSYKHYMAYGARFGLSTELLNEEMEQDGHLIDSQGFIESDGQGRKGGSSGLTQSPVALLAGLALVRNGGRSIDRTQTGQFLAGKIFTPQDFVQVESTRK